MTAAFHLLERVRHHGQLAVVERVRDTKGGELVDVRYVSGPWLGARSTVRADELERRSEIPSLRPISRSVA